MFIKLVHHAAAPPPLPTRARLYLVAGIYFPTAQIGDTKNHTPPVSTSHTPSLTDPRTGPLFYTLSKAPTLHTWAYSQVVSLQLPLLFPLSLILITPSPKLHSSDIPIFVSNTSHTFNHVQELADSRSIQLFGQLGPGACLLALEQVQELFQTGTGG